MSNSKTKSLEELVLSMIDQQDEQYKETDRRLDNIEKVLISQEINLKEHMRRSEALETIVSNIREKELQPLNRHVNMVEGAFKFLGLIALLLTIITGISKLFGVV